MAMLRCAEDLPLTLPEKQLCLLLGRSFASTDLPDAMGLPQTRLLPADAEPTLNSACIVASGFSAGAAPGVRLRSSSCPILVPGLSRPGLVGTYRGQREQGRVAAFTEGELTLLPTRRILSHYPGVPHQRG